MSDLDHDLDVNAIKADFPLLTSTMAGESHDQLITYLDSAASSQKPNVVIDTVSDYYRRLNANVARGVYELAEASTNAMEDARRSVARFVNAPSTNEIVFTRNATESINLVANTWGRQNLGAGDVVVLSQLEHHANIVPWHMLAAEKGIELRWVPLTTDGQLDMAALPALLDGAKVFSFTAMSNVLGTITPVQQLCTMAHDAGALAIVDGCQYVPHNITDVQAWGADFTAFSSHKLCGPSGIGVLWGREELLDAMPPFLGGGNMIADVRTDGFTCAELPAKFEAGTPPITEAVGLGAAIDFLTGLGMANVRQHEVDIATYAMRTLTDRFGDEIQLHGPCNVEVRGATFSIGFRGIHPHDLSQVLDQKNVCVRAGHHCAKPLMRVLGVNATARASFYVYNDTHDVDVLADALDGASDIFGF